jgi:hypothetical protein
VRPTSTDEVLDLLEAPSTSAALGAAFELALFWMLDRKPLDAASVATSLGIPAVRCRAWLQLLRRAGLLEEVEGAYRPSGTARAAILDRYSQQTQELLAIRHASVSPPCSSCRPACARSVPPRRHRARKPPTMSLG